MLAQQVLTALQLWLKDQRGQGMVEYGLILALIAVLVLATLSSLGTQIKADFCNVLNAMGGTCPA